MTATASGPIHLGNRHRAADSNVAAVPGTASRNEVVNRARRATPGLPARAAGGGERGDVERSAVSWRWSGAVTGTLQLLAIAWSIPFVMLLVGAPFALAIVLVLWLGRLALGAL